MDAKNVVTPTYEQLPEEARKLLEERKKKRDGEDLQAVLSSFTIDRRSTISKLKEVEFSSSSQSS